MFFLPVGVSGLCRLVRYNVLGFDGGKFAVGDIVQVNQAIRLPLQGLLEDVAHFACIAEVLVLVLRHVGKQGLEAAFSISRERVAVARGVELVK